MSTLGSAGDRVSTGEEGGTLGGHLTPLVV